MSDKKKPKPKKALDLNQSAVFTHKKLAKAAGGSDRIFGAYDASGKVSDLGYLDSIVKQQHQENPTPPYIALVKDKDTYLSLSIYNVDESGNIYRRDVKLAIVTDPQKTAQRVVGYSGNVPCVDLYNKSRNSIGAGNKVVITDLDPKKGNFPIVDNFPSAGNSQDGKGLRFILKSLFLSGIPYIRSALHKSAAWQIANQKGVNGSNLQMRSAFKTNFLPGIQEQDLDGTLSIDAKTFGDLIGKDPSSFYQHFVIPGKNHRSNKLAGGSHAEPWSLHGAGLALYSTLVETRLRVLDYDALGDDKPWEDKSRGSFILRAGSTDLIDNMQNRPLPPTPTVSRTTSLDSASSLGTMDSQSSLESGYDSASDKGSNGRPSPDRLENESPSNLYEAPVSGQADVYEARKNTKQPSPAPLPPPRLSQGSNASPEPAEDYARFGCSLNQNNQKNAPSSEEGYDALGTHRLANGESSESSCSWDEELYVVPERGAFEPNSYGEGIYLTTAGKVAVSKGAVDKQIQEREELLNALSGSEYVDAQQLAKDFQARRRQMQRTGSLYPDSGVEKTASSDPAFYHDFSGGRVPKTVAPPSARTMEKQRQLAEKKQKNNNGAKKKDTSYRTATAIRDISNSSTGIQRGGPPPISIDVK